jgi:hypothetical protein
MLAVCDFCSPKAPNPPKSLRHRHFYAGGFGRLAPNPPTNPPNLTHWNCLLWAGWASRAPFFPNSLDILEGQK